MAAPELMFGEARRISGRIPPTLELTDVLVANVEPQHAAPLVKALAKDLPLGKLQHLKRVRKLEDCDGDKRVMQVIMHTLNFLKYGDATAALEDDGHNASSCAGHNGGRGAGGPGASSKHSPSAPSGTCSCFAAHHTHRHPTTHIVTPTKCSGKCGGACRSLAAASDEQRALVDSLLPSSSPAAAPAVPHLPRRIAAVLAAARAALDVVRVPAVAPDNREQWAAWSLIWPMPWKLPSGQPHQDGQPADEDNQRYFERHMARVVAISNATNGANVCVIVDPSTGEVIAEAADAAGEHPLRHAVMEAVAAAAERDLRLWPVNGFVHLGRQEDTSVHGVNTIMSESGEAACGEGSSMSGDDDGEQRWVGAQQQQPPQQQHMNGRHEQQQEQQHMNGCHEQPHEQQQGEQEQQPQQEQQLLEDHVLSGLKHCHSKQDDVGGDSPAKRQRVTNGFGSHFGGCNGLAGHEEDGEEHWDDRQQQREEVEEGGGGWQQVDVKPEDQVLQNGTLPPTKVQCSVHVDARTPGSQKQQDEHPPPSPRSQQQPPQQQQQDEQHTPPNGLQQKGSRAQEQQQEPPPQQQQQQQPSAGPLAGGSSMESDSGSRDSRSRSSSRLPTPVPITSWANKPYLCNTYDAFLLREPCAMCGMALVHSRLARVVYCRRDTMHGALGGAFRLQANRSLNHHYEVFEMPLAICTQAGTSSSSRGRTHGEGGSCGGAAAAAAAAAAGICS